MSVSTFTKRNILEFVISMGSSPVQDDFKGLCEAWIFELFPETKNEKVKEFLRIYCGYVRKLWRTHSVTPSKVHILFNSKRHKSFFNTLVYFDPDPEPVQAASEPAQAEQASEPEPVQTEGWCLNVELKGANSIFR